MTHQELKAIADTIQEGFITDAIARINARCAGRRISQAEFDAMAFTHEARHASTLGMLGDASVRQRLIAAGVLS